MTLSKYLTLDNVLKTCLAIAVGILLYNIFFKKTEGYYNYQSIDKVSNHAYPMDYEDDEFAQEDDDAVVDPEDEVDEVVDDVEEVFDDSEESEDIVDEIVLDDSVDEEMYEYEESDEPYDDSADAEEDGVGEIPDEIYEEADSEEVEDEGVDAYNAYDFLYASDVEDGLQENFMLYENTVGEDVNYS
ncbi:hypothetical protein PBCVCVM1_669L [Paramecium bursaria Chlorella virus CVM-1]|nr:hypothetical protein PBCVCVM1_669L [Paramecium bursaria Chlorella virus CVM-1]